VISFRGTPGVTYGVQAAIEFAQPATATAWTNVASRTADDDGDFQVTVTTANPPSRFFRAMYPAPLPAPVPPLLSQPGRR